MFAMRDGQGAPERGALVAPEFAFLKNRTTKELLSLQQQFERGVKRHEDTQRFAAIVLGERGPEPSEGQA
jgi:hypothetical protein